MMSIVTTTIIIIIIIIINCVKPEMAEQHHDHAPPFFDREDIKAKNA